MSERIAYDEFGLFHENAEEFGLPYQGPPTVRRVAVPVAVDRQVSALVWGDAPPELVLVHGGAQNAHTWDTVALAIGRPMVCVDLPGHGHSDAPAAPTEGAEPRPMSLAHDLAVVIRALAPGAAGVVGMSLGGLTALSLTAVAPELVRSLAMIDITPGVNSSKTKAITDFVRGPRTFPSFEQLLERTIEHNPGRSVSSLRRGILHNAVQVEDGSWMWRYRRHDDPVFPEVAEPAADDAKTADAPPPPPLNPLWDVLEGVSVPFMLVRGMRAQSVVDDADEAELRRRLPSARIEQVDAGHSVQGDRPVELAALIEEFVFGAPSGGGNT